jgi:hypothetical protein
MGYRTAWFLFILSAITIIGNLAVHDWTWVVIGACFAFSSGAALWRHHTWPRRVRR